MKRPLRHLWIVTGICAACTAVVLWLWWMGFTPLMHAEFHTQDLRARLGRCTPVDPRLALIGVDRPLYEPSYFDQWEVEDTPAIRSTFTSFPWRRDVWAALITRLGDAGAKAIVIDFVFAANNDGDDELARALDKYRNQVVIGCNFDSSETARGGLFKIDLPNSTLIPPVGSHSAAEDDRVGYVNIWPSDDGVYRTALYHAHGDQIGNVFSPDTVLESLDARALRKFGRPDLIPKPFTTVLFRYTAPPGFGYVPIPVGEVLSPKLWKNMYHGGVDFRGKIVLIGPTADLFQDKHPVPLITPRTRDSSGHDSDMLGPEIHLNIINAALHDEFLHEPSTSADIFTILAAGLLTIAFSLFIRQPVTRLVVVVAAGASYWALAQWLFNHNGQLVLLAAPLLVLFIGSVTALTFDFLLEQRDKARVRKTLERYVSKNVVREVLDNPETYFNSLTGVRKPVTILFSDVRGFTTLTESADSAALVKQLNEYFEEMVALVFAREGSLDKFIGDAVMALWNAPTPVERHAERGCQAILACKEATADLYRSAGWAGLPPLVTRFGLHTDRVLVGHFGAPERMSFTAMGDGVNLASRLEALGKQYGVTALVSDSVVAAAGEGFSFRRIDRVAVKGKTKAVLVYELLGHSDAGRPSFVDAYEAALDDYGLRRFEAAMARLEPHLEDDPPSRVLFDRCRILAEHPPPEGWDGVFVATSK